MTFSSIPTLLKSQWNLVSFLRRLQIVTKKLTKFHWLLILSCSLLKPHLAALWQYFYWVIFTILPSFFLRCGRMNRTPNETRTRSWRFNSPACKPLYHLRHPITSYTGTMSQNWNRCENWTYHSNKDLLS